MPTNIENPVGAFVTTNPFGDVINGILQGAQLHDQIRRAQDEHVAMQQAQLQQARQNRIQDITQKMLLQTNSRPIGPDGTVTEETQLPDASVGGVTVPGATASITRKADKSRTVSYTDQDGNAMQRELLSAPEQIQRQAQDRATLARSGQVDVSGIMQSILGQTQGVATRYGEAPDPSTVANPTTSPAYNQFPNGVYVNPQQVPGILGDMVREQGNQRTNTAREAIATENNDAKKKIADDKLKAPPHALGTKVVGGDVVNIFSDGSTKVLGRAAAKPVASGGAAGATSGLTPEALDAAAKSVAGGMSLSQAVPGYGKEATAIRTAVFNRAVALNPQMSLTDAQSGYKANAGSLNALQKSRDQIASFENTAGKNLDQFLSTAKKVVDSGSPLINQPIRGLALRLSGNPDQAAFNTARQVAVTEIGKVLSNAGNGVLSDSARKEVQELIGPDASLKQIYSAAQILRSDMKNRGDSMDQQIAEIKGRINGSPSVSPENAAPKVTARFNPATGKIEPVQP